MAREDMYQQAVALIESSHKILVTTHTRPDGDAAGCVAAIAEVLTNLGKTVQPLLLSSLPQWYAFVFPEKVPVLGKDLRPDGLSQGAYADVDLIVLVDTNSYSQLTGLEDYLKQSRKPVLVIDHHITSDRLGRVEITDETAGAAGLVLYDFLKYVRWPITRTVAMALFVAIATDTGWFQLSNTDSRVYRSCAELVDLGVQPTELYKKLYQSFSRERFKLMVRMLDTLELHLDGRYASQYILLSNFAETGAAHADTENLINECQRIASVRVSALFVEQKDGRVRCSLRSRGEVDVSELAARFGGGGHRMASGTYLPGPMENARRLILDEVARRLAP
ncbi:MAG: bifunctional oligoribonuclease/PAP phosphatase NrnA [Sedimentisphaerales bacterium]|nr:bifunctional oligoribonuclease/PAP phosphatase NrnA [Sedimentisphaerales bacterium]